MKKVFTRVSPLFYKGFAHFDHAENAARRKIFYAPFRFSVLLANTRKAAHVGQGGQGATLRPLSEFRPMFTRVFALRAGGQGSGLIRARTRICKANAQKAKNIAPPPLWASPARPFFAFCLFNRDAPQTSPARIGRVKRCDNVPMSKTRHKTKPKPQPHDAPPTDAPAQPTTPAATTQPQPPEDPTAPLSLDEEEA